MPAKPAQRRFAPLRRFAVSRRSGFAPAAPFHGDARGIAVSRPPRVFFHPDTRNLAV
jgi:hypothetical protein